MKMSQAELDAFRAGITSGLAGIHVAGVRKSLSDPTPRVEVVEENYCFSKYLRGGITGRWDGAEVEQKIFKALNESIGTAGGFMVPTQTSNELVELLKAKTVVRQMPGVRVLPMTGNKMEMGKVNAGPSVTWGGENTQIAEDTGMTFGQLVLQLKKCVCLYKMSRELLRDASPGVDALVKSELADALALAEDLAFLEGTGGTQPMGLYYNPLILNTDLSGAATYDTIADAMYQVESNNGMLTGWVTNPRLKNSLRKLKDGNGQYLYADGRSIVGGNVEMPQLGGAPVGYSTQVPVTLRPGANESYLMGGQWSNLIIGEKAGIRIETTDTGGDAFEYDQTWIKAVREVDSVLRHPKTFVRVIGIQA